MLMYEGICDTAQLHPYLHAHRLNSLIDTKFYANAPTWREEASHRARDEQSKDPIAKQGSFASTYWYEVSIDVPWWSFEDYRYFFPLERVLPIKAELAD